METGLEHNKEGRQEMKRMNFFASMLVLWMVFMSCEHKELCYDHDLHAHYVRVYVDENLLNVTHGFYNDDYVRPTYNSPQILRLILSDTETGRAVAERFLRTIGRDKRGVYYEGHIVASPGRYSLMAYNYDTETTRVKDYANLSTAKAYTNEIATHLYARIPSRTMVDDYDEAERITYEPDHLFAANCGDIIVPAHADAVDTLTNTDGDYFTAKSIVRSFYLQIQVKGMQYATSSVGLLTGMSGSSWVNGSGMDLKDNVTVFFEMQPGENKATGLLRRGTDENSTMTLYTTFSTFGKLPDRENNLEITFDFLTTYGKPYSETINITDLFFTPEAQQHQWLLIDHTITIPEPPAGQGGGGGLNPGVDDWKDIETDITI